MKKEQQRKPLDEDIKRGFGFLKQQPINHDEMFIGRGATTGMRARNARAHTIENRSYHTSQFPKGSFRGDHQGQSKQVKKGVSQIRNVQLQTKFSQRVLYDNKRMIKGEQDKRISTLMKGGTRQLHEIKNTRITSDMELENQLETYKTQLIPFYKQKKINIITEDMIRSGIDELPSTADLDKERQKYENKQKFQEFVEGQVQADKEQYAAGQVLVSAIVYDKAEKIHGLNTKKEKDDAERNIDNIQMKEADIIHQLYSQHFVQKREIRSPGEPQYKNMENSLSGQGQDKILSQYLNETKPKNAASREYKASESGDTKKPTVAGGDAVTKQTEDEDELEDEFKYIQYIPKAGGRNDHGLDRAIRQLYVPREHPRVKPASPTKHGGFEQMFIRKPGNRADQEFEDSIDQASANSFSVNGQVPSEELNKRQEQLKSYLYGEQIQHCHKNHIHSKGSAKEKEFDIAELQTKAFKFMVLQKPKVNKGTTHFNIKPYQASFLPTTPMSQELQQAFTDNLNFQELLANPAAFQNEVAKASRFKANQSPMFNGLMNSTKAGEGYKTIDINLTNELENFEIDPPDQKDEKLKSTLDASSVTKQVNLKIEVNQKAQSKEEQMKTFKKQLIPPEDLLSKNKSALNKQNELDYDQLRVSETINEVDERNNSFEGAPHSSHHSISDGRHQLNQIPEERPEASVEIFSQKGQNILHQYGQRSNSIEVQANQFVRNKRSMQSSPNTASVRSSSILRIEQTTKDAQAQAIKETEQTFQRTQKQNELDQREIQNQLLVQAQAQRQEFEVMAGFKMGFNKKKWKSPYEHRSECKDARKRNIQMSKLSNIEKSVNTANNISQFYMQHNKKRNSYTTWANTEIYQKHIQQERMLQDSIFQNQQMKNLTMNSLNHTTPMMNHSSLMNKQGYRTVVQVPNKVLDQRFDDSYYRNTSLHKRGDMDQTPADGLQNSQLSNYESKSPDVIRNANYTANNSNIQNGKGMFPSNSQHTYQDMGGDPNDRVDQQQLNLMMYDTEDGRGQRGPPDLLNEDFHAGRISQGEHRSITNSEVYETHTNQIETREPRRESKKSKSNTKKRAQSKANKINVVIQTSKSSHKKSDRKHMEYKNKQTKNQDINDFDGSAPVSDHRSPKNNNYEANLPMGTGYDRR